MTFVRTLAGLLLLSALACNSAAPVSEAPPANPPAPATKATLTANPNPVAAGAGHGTTTVTWNTGDDSWGQVYLAVEGQPEVLFVEGASGSKAAPWISAGVVYEFRLYAGKERKTVLSAVKVTRSSS